MRHHPDDCAQEPLWAAYTACDLGHHGIGQAPVLQSVVESLSGPWRLASVLLKALGDVEATTLCGFRVFFGV